MPTLPTLTVTQAQADRLLAAFGSQAAYKQWLKDNIIAFVVEHEAQATLDAARQTVLDNETQLTTDLSSA